MPELLWKAIFAFYTPSAGSELSIDERTVFLLDSLTSYYLAWVISVINLDIGLYVIFLESLVIMLSFSGLWCLDYVGVISSGVPSYLIFMPVCHISSTEFYLPTSTKDFACIYFILLSTCLYLLITN